MNDFQKFMVRRIDHILDVAIAAVVLFKEGTITKEQCDGTLDDLLISHPVRNALFKAYESHIAQK